MKKLLRRFLEISAHGTGKPIGTRVQDGTIGFGEYIHLIANGLMLVFSLLVLGVIFGPIYFLIVRPYEWTKKRIADDLNRIRVGVPKSS
ncbi:MAG: hypothetical protein ABH822_01250 [Patescibacteria group bacterium]